jgi:hypothetical protein
MPRNSLTFGPHHLLTKPFQLFFAKPFNLVTNAFVCRNFVFWFKPFSTSTPIFLKASRRYAHNLTPLDNHYLEISIVFAFAGDSTITKFLPLLYFSETKVEDFFRFIDFDIKLSELKA